uniref:Uncharacterized protein n=1 Tax=Anguilla anguilla TaxID=7936 RepID=A0A0E9QSD1_ANGAN
MSVLDFLAFKKKKREKKTTPSNYCNMKLNMKYNIYKELRSQ